MNAGILVGMIYVFQMGQYRLSPDAPNLLQSFADQAAIAVKNARLYQEVNAEKQRLDAIVEQSADGVLLLNAQGIIVGFNSALSRMTGWNANDAIGKAHDDVMLWEKLKTDTDLMSALQDGNFPPINNDSLYVEGELQRVDVGTIHLGITYAPVLDRGRIVNIVANVRDMTRYQEEQELQKTFISVVSHELKTPVSIIKGYAGTLARQDANWPPEVQQEYLAVIEEEADNLTDLIDNLLEASRLQSGTFKLNLTSELYLPAMAQLGAKKFRTQTNKHKFALDFPDDFPVIFGDERRITQVFNNLISNAIKYSPNGGTIRIGGVVDSTHVMVSVTDTGIGIPDHQKHRIFQKFSRLDNALSRQTEGTGLGLFLTKAIVNAHNGRIWFEDNPNGGTIFTFALPRNKDMEIGD
jgi:PAS domain S-box-containing protein